MLNNSLDAKSHDVSWASQSDLLMEIFCRTILSIFSFNTSFIGSALITPVLQFNVGLIIGRKHLISLEFKSPIK